MTGRRRRVVTPPLPCENKRVPSIYDLVMWAYYAGRRRRPPDPIGFVLAQPGWLDEGGRVLDFGGGDGRWALRMADARSAEVTVVDIDVAALRRVPRHARVRAVHLDAPVLPFPEHAFDLVFVHHVVHHVQDLPQALREWRRVIRPGGRIVCIEFHPDCPVTRVYRALSRFRRHPCAFYSPAALAALLAAPPFVAGHEMLDAFQYVASGQRPGA